MNSITEIRLRLHRRGYRIIPTYGKIARLHGWHSAEFVARELNEKRIISWERRYPELQSVGVRLDLGLGAIDGDVDNQELAEAAWVAVTIAAPQVASGAPLRYGKSPDKFALFVRIEGEAFPRMESRYYLRPEALAAWQAERAAAAEEAIRTGEKPRRVLDPPTHKIEIFSGRPAANGNCARHFSVAGPHSYSDDGTVAATYSWADGPTLENTPLEGLPTLTAAQASAIIDEFDRLAVEQGWVALPKAVGGDRGVAYDITEATRFDTNKGGEQIDYDELCAEYALYGSSLRCSANFLPGRGADGNRSHCVVGDDNRHGCVAVHVFGDDCTHFPVELEPDHDQKILDRSPMLPPEALTDSVEPPEPPADTDINEKAAWLRDTRAYYEGGDTVVRIYADTLDCESTPSAFHRRYRHMHVPNPDKRFKRAVFATDLWEMTPQRRNIAGVRMRPDRPFPLFEENGQLYKNTYCRPRHETSGGANVATLCAPFVAFMERFLPDRREREWFYDWMAHKQRHPEIPGTSIFFVADDADSVDRGTFGTGRGLLSRIVRKLYGEQYCASQSFSMLDGTSSQSQFNDWLHGSILVTVDEARTSKTAHRRGERNAAFEVLKDIVDPAPKQHSFKGKNRRAFIGMSYCSIWLFTNHGDAAAIPEHDRRFTVLRNGREITPEERAEILTWMETPGAIAALSAVLAARDLTGFDMQQPLQTAAKTEMAELSRSDVEELLRDIMDDGGRGKVFTKSHIEAAIGSNYNGQGTYWRGEFSGVWSQYCVGLKNPDGGPRRVRIYGTQKKLFCFRSQHAHVKKMPEAAIQREVAKWGGGDPVEGLIEVDGLNEKQ
jgi:hypothetical protein